MNTRTSLLFGVGSIALLVFPAAGADQTATWNNNTGNWSDAAEWTTNPLFPDNGNGGFTYDASQNGGTLTLDQDITIEKFVFAGGTLTGASPFLLTLNDLLTWSGGTLTGQPTVQANGGINFNGTTRTLSAATLNNAGAATWTAGVFNSGQGAVFNNQTGASFDTNFDGIFAFNQGGVATQFNNAGTLTKSGGTGTSTFSIAVNNTGTVNANSGTLSFTGGGVSTGAFGAAAGATLDFGGGIHDLNAGSVVSGAGTVEVSGGTWNFNAGTYNVAGTTTINGGLADFNATASAAVLNLFAGTLGGTGTLTVSGPLAWNGGTMTDAGITQANGGMILGGANKFLNGGRTLNNAGAATWTAGNINSGQGAVFNNQTGASFDTTFDGIFTFNQGGAATQFNNAGTLTKSGGTGTSTFGVAINNTGTVNANSGTLSFTGGGSATGGDFSVAAGATLQFSGSPYTADAASTFGGDGTVRFTGDTHTINGAYDVGTTTVSGGNAVFTTNATFGTLNLQNDPNSVFLTATGTNTVTTAFNWTGGQLRGSGTTTIASGATFSLVGGINVVLGGTGGAHTLINNSSSVAMLSGKSLFFRSGATFENNGSFEVVGTAGFAIQSGGGAFLNNGTFTKSGVGTSVINPSVAFHNTGAVNVNSGTLRMTGGGTATSGDFSVAAGAVLQISGSYSADAASTFGGDGTVQFIGGTATINGAYNVGATTVSGGNAIFTTDTTFQTLNLQNDPNIVFLTATGANTVTTAFNWTGGQLRGSGTTTIASGATFSLVGGINAMLGGTGGAHTLINNSSSVATLSGKSLFFRDGATFENNGSFEVVGTAGFAQQTGGGTFLNNGTFTKSGVGTSGIGSDVAFTNTGTVSINAGTLNLIGSYTQTAGTTVLNGGSLTKTNTALAIAGGSLEGDGTITGNVSNDGIIAPGALVGTMVGTITIDGDLSLSSTSQFNFDIGGTVQGSTYDALFEAGSVALTLDGQLTLSLISGFTPTPGDTFTILSSNDDLAGQFANVANGDRLLTSDGLSSFQVDYGVGSPFGANSVVLSNFAVPEPGSAMLVLLAVALMIVPRVRIGKTSDV